MALTAHRSAFDGDTSTRLNDYLNDKLQTFADFETLDSLLVNVKGQQELLRKQLEDAEQALKGADKASAKQDAIVGRQIQVYEQEAADIDRRLRIVTQSETSDDAVQRFDASMEKLNRLDIANGYLGILANVERFSAQSISCLNNKPEEALRSFAQLCDVLTDLKSSQEDAEGAAPHLVDHVEQSTNNLRQTIKESLATELTKVLDKILWPRPDVKLPDGMQEQWNTACMRLLSLQRPQLAAEASSRPTSVQNKTPGVLVPLEVMVRPLDKAFRFHFDGDKPTNRLDKPEYFLAHALSLLATYTPFIVDNFQPILLEFTRGTDLAFHAAYVDATTAFIAAILPMLRTKIFALVHKLLSQPNLLSHLIHELISFDNALRGDWHYSGDGVTSGSLWKGLTWEVLTHNDWFERWLQVEKDFALARYDSIVNDADSSTLDFDSLDEKATKPTKAAIRVNDLLETITDLYRPLTSFSHKVRFLIDIQVSILDRFHARLNSGLEAFLSMSSSIGRTVKGASAADLASIQGLNGLDRLCRIFGSAEYLERAMSDWSDGVFFLDLWSELQYRAKTSSEPLANDPDRTENPPFIIGPLSIAEVASRTSSKLAENAEDNITGDTSITGALFDETAGAYARLRDRSETVIVDTLNSNLRESLRSYARSNTWSSLSAPSAPMTQKAATDEDESLSASINLNPVLQYLSSHLGFLARAIAPSPYRRICRQVMRTLDSYVFDRIIMVNTFSIQGARQLAVDVEALVSLADRITGSTFRSKGLQRTLEAMTILVLSATDRIASVADGEGDAVRGDVAMAKSEGDELDIWAVERRLFESNESARNLLEDLGLTNLTEIDAREILRRRIELRT